MGDYLSIRMAAPLNEVGLAVAKRMSAQPWASWGEIALEYPQFAEFGQMDRATAIPYGSVCYAPHGWDNENLVGEDGSWLVCCSIKVGYQGTLWHFLELVLPRLIRAKTSVDIYNELTGRKTIREVDPCLPS